MACSGEQRLLDQLPERTPPPRLRSGWPPPTCRLPRRPSDGQRAQARGRHWRPAARRSLRPRPRRRSGASLRLVGVNPPGGEGPRWRPSWRCRGRRSSLHSRSRSLPRAAPAPRSPLHEARSAPRRCSLSVRSIIRTPSRWSISCWSTRASNPDPSIRTESAGRRFPGCGRSGRSTSTTIPGKSSSSATARSSEEDHSTRG